MSSQEEGITYYKDKITRLRNVLTIKQEVITKLRDNHVKLLHHFPQFTNVQEGEYLIADMIVNKEEDFDILGMYPDLKIRDLTIRILLQEEETRLGWRDLAYSMSKLDNDLYTWKHCNRHAHVFRNGKTILTYFDPEHNIEIFLKALKDYPDQLNDIDTLTILDSKRHVRENNDAVGVCSDYEQDYTDLRTSCKRLICQDHISLVCELNEEEPSETYHDVRGGEYIIEGRHHRVFNERTRIINLSDDFIVAMNRHPNITWMS
jgi:hypothetical protein